MGRFREAMADDGGDHAIDISPLIDCVFILLIFFIVTTTFVEETGVEVDKPQAASASQLEKNSIMIALTKQGEIVAGGRSIGIGGVRQHVRRLLQQEPSLPVILEADIDSLSGQLMKVIDECKLGGAEQVSVATRLGKG